MIWPVVRKVEVCETGAKRSRRVSRVEWMRFMLKLGFVKGRILGRVEVFVRRERL